MARFYSLALPVVPANDGVLVIRAGRKPLRIVLRARATAIAGDLIVAINQAQILRGIGLALSTTTPPAVTGGGDFASFPTDISPPVLGLDPGDALYAGATVAGVILTVNSYEDGEAEPSQRGFAAGGRDIFSVPGAGDGGGSNRGVGGGGANGSSTGNAGSC